MRNSKLEELCKNIDSSQNERVAKMYNKWGVDTCKAPNGCESLQYQCHSWKCKYDNSKSAWANDPAIRHDARLKGDIARAKEWGAHHPSQRMEQGKTES